MPTVPKGPCLVPSCPRRAVLNGRCEPHAHESERASSAKRGYTRTWREYAQGWLRDYPHCGDRVAGPSPEHSRCVELGLIVRARHVDHIKPHRGDRRLFDDPRNHQSLCSSCHSRKTATHDGGFGRGR